MATKMKFFLLFGLCRVFSTELTHSASDLEVFFQKLHLSRRSFTQKAVTDLDILDNGLLKALTINYQADVTDKVYHRATYSCLVIYHPKTIEDRRSLQRIENPIVKLRPSAITEYVFGKIRSLRTVFSDM